VIFSPITVEGIGGTQPVGREGALRAATSVLTRRRRLTSLRLGQRLWAGVPGSLAALHALALAA
jgi:hypothetical protein